MAKTVRIDHFKNYRFLTMLRATQDGKLSFLVKQADMDSDSYKTNLCLYSNEEARMLTGAGDVTAYWWRDGDTIIFAALREEKDKERVKKGLPLTVLYSLRVDRPGEAELFLRLPYDVTDIVFLPDGRLVFSAEYDAHRECILGKSDDEEAAAKALAKERDYEVLEEIPFTENGSGYISGKRNRLYMYEEGVARAVVDEKTTVSQLRLSPNGRHLFFVSQRYEGKMTLDDNIIRWDTDTDAMEDVSFARGVQHAAYAVVDDDTLLVYATDMQDYGVNQNGGFYRVSLREREGVLLYGEGAYSGYDSVGSDLKMAAEPVWQVTQTQGRRNVLWSTTLGHSSHLMNIDVDAGEITQMTGHPGSVSEFAYTGDAIYYVAMRGLEGQELYTVTPSGQELKLTSFNGQVSREYALSTPQEICFVNSEGNTIQGWVLKPIDFDPSISWPAILDIHGGPKTVYGTVAYHEMQYWANLGFAVLYCNPTGSDGGGDEFADIRGRYGLIDYEDIMQFVDVALAEHPWIDGDRLGVTGGSYGGFMTNWMIGHTDRFKAAASQRSIANWMTLSTLSDIGYYFGPDQMGDDIWGDVAAVWEQSPLKYANRVTTPTLFIHSDEDYRCPLAEGVQMFTALRTFGIEARLCMFRGENHELSRSGKPSHRVRRLQEITAWFEKYLRSEEQENAPEPMRLFGDE